MVNSQVDQTRVFNHELRLQVLLFMLLLIYTNIYYAYCVRHNRLAFTQLVFVIPEIAGYELRLTKQNRRQREIWKSLTQLSADDVENILFLHGLKSHRLQ